MIFDADVLVWFTRGNERALRATESDEERSLSVVTRMELARGAFDKRDLRGIMAYLAEYDFRVLPLTESIGHRASTYIEEHALRSGLGVVDALVAATAVESKLTLVTGNVRHYRAIADLEIKAFRP